MEDGSNKIKKWLFNLVTLLPGLYFLVVFHINEGFPPCTPIDNDNWIFLFVAIFLLLLPFANRIKLGQLIEFEREIKTVQKNVDDFRSEVRNTISVLSSTVNTISAISNQVTVNIPSATELRQAKDEVSSLSIKSTLADEEDIRNELVLEDEDTIIALSKIRIRIEQLLRRILGKRLESSDRKEKEIKYLSARNLFDKFAKANSAYGPLRRPLFEVLQVCNAAMHGQRIPEAEATAAIDLGTKIIALLADLDEGND